MPVESEISVFQDRKQAGEWRVEYFDEDGGCYVTLFVGPEAERRARDYADALRAGVVSSWLRSGQPSIEKFVCVGPDMMAAPLN
jgi:hypothetical protein